MSKDHFFPATRGDRQPYFRHDTTEHRFRGSFIRVTSSGRSTVYDVYVIGAVRPEDKSLLLRSGNDGASYESFPRHIAELVGKAVPHSAYIGYALELAESSTILRPARGNGEGILDDAYEPFTVRRFGYALTNRHEQHEQRRCWWVIDVHPDVEASLKDRETLVETLHAHFPATRCHHSHDCCGHWYSHRAKLTELPTRGTWLVSQDSYMNV